MPCRGSDTRDRADRFARGRGHVAQGRHLGAVGLPTGTNYTNSMVWSPKRLIGHMAKDKKASGGRLTFILARGIGEAFVTRDVPDGELTAFMEGAVAA